MQGLAFSLGLIFAVGNVFFRDVGQLLVLLLQLWFWATPIVYTSNIIPETMRFLLYMNPLYGYIEALHQIVVSRVWPGAGLWLAMLLPTVVFWLAARWLLYQRRGELRDAL
jgi:lipopolysaccharide transport system permease protein